MKRTSRRLALRREALAEITAGQLAGAVAAADRGDTVWNCPTGVCIVLTGRACYTTPLHNTCWACG